MFLTIKFTSLVLLCFLVLPLTLWLQQQPYLLGV